MRTRARLRKRQLRMANYRRRNQIHKYPVDADVDLIIPKTVTRRENSEGEEYFEIRTVDGCYYTLRDGVVFDHDGWEKGLVPEAWQNAIKAMC